MEFEICHYRRLAANVIGRARADAIHGAGARQMDGCRFFTDSSGALDFWASIAGVDPTDVRAAFQRTQARQARTLAQRRDHRLAQRRESTARWRRRTSTQEEDA